MKIVTWNVNSLLIRLQSVERYILEYSPDILLLQEIKTVNTVTPAEFFENLGYNVTLFGQKSYNGVAIVSRFGIEDVTQNLPNFPDENARYVEAFTGGVRVASVYVPNGQEIGSEKFQNKLYFLQALYEHMQSLLQYEEKVIVGGDFNVAPTKIDTYDYQTPEVIHTSLLERAAFRTLLSKGYADIHRSLYPEKDQWFSWWDYRAGSWTHNKGLRIDHLLLSPQACDVTIDCGIHSDPRGWERPSDHTPVWVELLLQQN